MSASTPASLFTGSGSPNNVVVAPSGSFYVDLVGGGLWHKNVNKASQTDASGWVQLNLNVGTCTMFTGSGAPTSASGMGFAGTGSIYVDTTNAQMYLNSGTAASPVWKELTRAA